MKGWVYVISNKSIPGSVKIGYSSKDPEARAKELNNTGVPHPYQVEYEILVENPYQLEQLTHKNMKGKRDNKEWFRCTAEEAIACIKQTHKGTILSEIFKSIERQKVEKSLKQKRILDDQNRKMHAKVKQEEARFSHQEKSIQESFNLQKHTRYPETNFWTCCLIAGLLSVTAAFLINKDLVQDDSQAFIIFLIGGGIGGYLIHILLNKLRQSHKGYKKLIDDKSADLSEERSIHEQKIKEIRSTAVTETNSLLRTRRR